MRRQARQAEQQRQDDDDEDDSADAEGDDDAAARQQEEMQDQQQQACVKCGKRQGWSIPSKGGWELVALPAGTDSWSASTLLEEQARDRIHEFRCGPLVETCASCACSFSRVFDMLDDWASRPTLC